MSKLICDLSTSDLTGLLVLGVPRGVTVDLRIPATASYYDATTQSFATYRVADNYVLQCEQASKRRRTALTVLLWPLSHDGGYAHTGAPLRAADLAARLDVDGGVHVDKDRSHAGTLKIQLTQGYKGEDDD